MKIWPMSPQDIRLSKMWFTTFRTRRNADCIRIVTIFGSWYGRYEAAPIEDMLDTAMTLLLSYLLKEVDKSVVQKARLGCRL